MATQENLSNFIDFDNWNGFVDAAHNLDKQSKLHFVGDLVDMLYHARSMDAFTKSGDSEDDSDAKKLRKYMHYCRDNKLISVKELIYPALIQHGRDDAKLLVDVLSNAVHDFDLHNACDRDGLLLLNAAILNSDDATLLYKGLITMGCDINKVNGEHGKSIHFVDVSVDGAISVFQHLIECGADPLELIDYKPYPQAFLLDYMGGTPVFHSFREYVEQNYDYEAEDDDLPDGYDEAVLDAFIAVLDKMENNVKAMEAVSHADVISHNRRPKVF